jgi:hypothetical protein
MPRPRRAGSVKACRTSASDDGSMTAAAQPWTNRAPVSIPRPGAAPQAIEASVNPATPLA